MYDKNFSDNPLEFKIVNFICVAGFILVIGNIFFGYYFTFSEDGKFYITSYFDMIIDISLLLIALKFVWRQKVPLTEKILITTATIILILSGFFFYNDGSCWAFVIAICYVAFIYMTLYKRREIKFEQKKK